MTRPAITLFMIAVALGAISPAAAQPMKCSGEEATCQKTCAKVPAGTTSACLTECGARKMACIRTGCWDNGRQRYCGLTKQ